MDDKTFEGLIVLEYLKIGIIPFFPKKNNLPINSVLPESDVSPKRKFRKLYKKARKKFYSKSSLVYVEKKYGAAGQNPTPLQMARRKHLVWKYISLKVKTNNS
ncbi:MAG: hypothetical protein CBC29_07360 [Methylococcaceae bacterium TMED69]|nr:MAG: hypothetical protein CBC29_05540 [Methylococcaceae bacterium TMED69]OUU74938.1 MAG: hypothetical protein CBC29_07360 [Methylococcaceae bacterium TMED69]|tara:strand:- start:250 stop:558 length:309 start_codon:yes stop_codon:yes gene_type:complete